MRAFASLYHPFVALQYLQDKVLRTRRLLSMHALHILIMLSSAGKEGLVNSPAKGIGQVLRSRLEVLGVLAFTHLHLHPLCHLLLQDVHVIRQQARRMQPAWMHGHSMHGCMGNGCTGTACQGGEVGSVYPALLTLARLIAIIVLIMIR